MNMQLSFQTLFVLVATLASMVVSLACSSSLYCPVAAIVRFVAAAPTWIVSTRHFYCMGFVKAFFRAVVILSSLVWLYFKKLPTAGTVSDYSRRVFDNFILSLPRPRAFPTAKVMFIFCAWRYSLLRTAEIAVDEYRLVVTGATKVFLCPVCVPVRSINRSVA